MKSVKTNSKTPALVSISELFNDFAVSLSKPKPCLSAIMSMSVQVERKATIAGLREAVPGGLTAIRSVHCKSLLVKIDVEASLQLVLALRKVVLSIEEHKFARQAE